MRERECVRMCACVCIRVCVRERDRVRNISISTLTPGKCEHTDKYIGTLQQHVRDLIQAMDIKARLAVTLNIIKKSLLSRGVLDKVLTSYKYRIRTLIHLELSLVDDSRSLLG